MTAEPTCEPVSPPPTIDHGPPLGERQHFRFPATPLVSAERCAGGSAMVHCPTHGYNTGRCNPTEGVPMPEPLTESQFQAQVVELAHVCGWRVLHVRRSIGKGQRWTTSTSITGWPDLFLFRAGEVFVVELKTDDPTSQPTPEQTECLADLTAAGIETHLWRPSDWPTIERRLSRRPHPSDHL